jgi:hypothetical protein
LLDSRLQPIKVDSLHARARFALSDRSTLAIDYLQDTWSGATPISTAPVVARTNTANTVTGASPWADPLGLNTRFFVDKYLNLYRSANIFASAAGAPDSQLTHTLSSASPETRKQVELKIGHEWNDRGATIGAGLSHEADYESWFMNLGGRLDLNQKLTSLSMGLSYTHNQTNATFDPEPSPFITLKPGDSLSVRARSEELGAQAGISQVLGKNSVIDVGVGYSHSQGYLTNPYKMVSEFDIVTPVSVLNANPDPRFVTDIYSVLERRPDRRGQFNASLGYRHYIGTFDAALRLGYQYSQDTWDIRSHALTTEWVQPFAGWTLIPRVRYYSQSAANFYLPYIATFSVTDASGNPIDHPLNRPAPTYYSSDHRLSGFGTLSGGLTASRQLARGIGLEFSYESYRHEGDLKLGGDGEAAFADFRSYTLNASLKVDLDTRNAPGAADAAPAHSGHAGHAEAGAPMPAGLMYAHAPGRAGEVMIGYRTQFSRQAGGMLHGTRAVSLDTVRLEACGSTPCETAPSEMSMTMHMLDIMFAPTDWLTLMVMPQWMDMDMGLTPLRASGGSGHGHGSGGDPLHHHQTGGVGDTGLAALFKLLDTPAHRASLALGFSAPTGAVDIALRKTPSTYATDQVSPALIHYGMQLGSGTWDFLPHLTYTAQRGEFSWGTQLGGVLRLEERNESNYALGDLVQASAWGGYQINRWLGVTLRAAYLQQGAIEGAYRPPVDADGNVLTPVHQGSADQPANYGGRFWDAGLGLTCAFCQAAI